MARPLLHSQPKKKVTISIRADWLHFIDDLARWGVGNTTGAANRSQVIEQLIEPELTRLLQETGKRLPRR